MDLYTVTLTGTQPLLQHADDIEWADQMDEWKLDSKNKKTSKAGDDRTPAHRWIGKLYRSAGDDSQIVIPTENIMRCLMEGAVDVLVPGGKRGKTFKSQSQSGIQPTDYGWPLLVDGKPIPFKPIEKLMNEKDFKSHKETAIDLGFSLFLKRARIGQSKHIRVRPRFENWSAIGVLAVTDEQITHAVLQDILDICGRYKGVCDWRPSSKTPGTFGMFKAVVERGLGSACEGPG